MERFICIADRDETHFCLVDAGGVIHKLNGAAGAPADYLALWQHARQEGVSVSEMAGELARSGRQLDWTIAELDVTPAYDKPHLTWPFTPPEVWGAAFTYLRGEQTLDTPLIMERRATEPIIFFKSTPHRYVAPNDAVGSRADARLMIPEPELGLILSADGEVIGYTIVNDVSSRDFPQRDPLYVTYSKTFDRCVSFGPIVVAPESVNDPLALDVTCRVTRAGKLLWEETGSTGRIYWSHEELIHYLTAHNRPPDGTLLATGTVLGPPADMHITDGDYLEVEIDGIGRLANPVVTV